MGTEEASASTVLLWIGSLCLLLAEMEQGCVVSAKGTAGDTSLSRALRQSRNVTAAASGGAGMASRSASW